MHLEAKPTPPQMGLIMELHSDDVDWVAASKQVVEIELFQLKNVKSRHRSEFSHAVEFHVREINRQFAELSRGSTTESQFLTRVQAIVRHLEIMDGLHPFSDRKPGNSNGPALQISHEYLAVYSSDCRK